MIAALPVLAGAVKVTLAAVLLVAVAVPIVGAPGDVGHRLCLRYPACSLRVHIPLAEVVVGVTGDLVMKPPGYCVLI